MELEKEEVLMAWRRRVCTAHFRDTAQRKGAPLDGMCLCAAQCPVSYCLLCYLKKSVLTIIISTYCLKSCYEDTTLGQSVHGTPICWLLSMRGLDTAQMRLHRGRGGARQWDLWRPWRQRHGLSLPINFDPLIQFLALEHRICQESYLIHLTKSHIYTFEKASGSKTLRKMKKWPETCRRLKRILSQDLARILEQKKGYDGEIGEIWIRSLVQLRVD